MSGITVAALALAVALLMHAVSPRQRLAVPTRRPARAGWKAIAVVAFTVAAASLPLSASIAASILAGTMTWRIRRRNRHRNAVRDGRALAGALEVFVGELRIGAHPVRALSAAAADTAGPVGAALSTAAARAGLGASVAEGLRGAGMRSPLSSDFDRLALSWQLAVDHGLAVSVLMRAAQTDIVERQRFSARFGRAWRELARRPRSWPDCRYWDWSSESRSARLRWLFSAAAGWADGSWWPERCWCVVD